MNIRMKATNNYIVHRSLLLAKPAQVAKSTKFAKERLKACVCADDDERCALLRIGWLSWELIDLHVKEITHLSCMSISQLVCTTSTLRNRVCIIGKMRLTRGTLGHLPLPCPPAAASRRVDYGGHCPVAAGLCGE